MSSPTRLGLAGLVAAVLATTAAGQEPKYNLEDLSPVGKPAGFKTGLSTRYAIWYEDGTWHVRTTTGAKAVQAFGGTIEIIGGKMTSLQPIAIEGKGAKKGTDSGTWNKQGTVFKFGLRTGKGYQDGFDLKVSDKATAIKFTLLAGGEEEPRKVFVGAKGAHPKATTFYLPAHPGK
jgi:hypothetical protein